MLILFSSCNSKTLITICYHVFLFSVNSFTGIKHDLSFKDSRQHTEEVALRYSALIKAEAAALLVFKGMTAEYKHDSAILTSLFLTNEGSKLRVNASFSMTSRAGRQALTVCALGCRGWGGCLGNSLVQIIITVTVSAHPTYNRNGS